MTLPREKIVNQDAEKQEDQSQMDRTTRAVEEVIERSSGRRAHPKEHTLIKH